jgi:amino acid adenylation domain-containing protein
VETDNGTAKFDLFISLVEEPDRLRGAIEYSTDLFDGKTIAQMWRHYRAVLEAIVMKPETRLSDLPLLDTEEKQRLLIAWNNTLTDYPKGRSIHRLFENQVDRSPEALALTYEGEHLTYRELNQRANRLAHYLKNAGVEREALVGICMERSAQMVVALLAVLKAGGAYLPLDPAYPEERLAFMLEDAQASIVITESGQARIAPRDGVKVVCLDAIKDWVARQSPENPATESAQDNLAYVIYTSGSTGKPKGVQIQHSGVVNFLNSMRRQPGLSSEESLLSVTTLSFDIAGLEIFLPLTVGAHVILVSREVAADGRQLLEKLQEHEATVMQSTPATWRMLLEAGWAGSQRLKILCGGEPLPQGLASQLIEKGSSVWNLYGPTETTIWSATRQVVSAAGPVSIGRPIDNTQIYILDAHFEPVPIGVAGELYIGGAGLARGYLNRPELTAEKFLPSPFGDRPGARLYRTGDLARYRRDGDIEVLGRIDHQVKVRGFRIELGEIESVLAKHPDIRQAVVTSQEDDRGDRRLAAFLVPKQKSAPPPSELRSFIRTQLPDYMVPSFFVTLDALPLTPNGKVNRQALAAVEAAGSEPAHGIVKPRNRLELELLRIWEEVLNIKSIGVNDNFFELGGHSIIAVRLFAQIEKKFEKKLPLATLFRAPTIEQLASYLRHEKSEPSWSSLVAIQPSGSKPPFFCVHAHGGNVLNFHDLARCLGTDQPFYGLQAQGLDGQQPGHNRIEEMAAHYLNEIKTVQPEGPYFLGGYCFGGKVAFEMARQLKAAGERVALLAVIDSYAPGYPKLRSWYDRKIKQRFFYHWYNLRGTSAKEKLHYLLRKGQILKSRLETFGNRMASRVYSTMGISLPPRLEPFRQRKRARSTYGRQTYSGRIIVFSPVEGPAWVDHQPDMGWEGLADEGLEIHELGSYAHMIFEPFVGELANRLAECIEKAQAIPQGTSDRSPEAFRNHQVLERNASLSIAGDS